MQIKRFMNTRSIVLTVLVILAIFPPIIYKSEQYTIFLCTSVLMYAVLASAWNIIGGMGGQLDLACGAYVGLGAFTAGTLLMRFNLTPWIGMFLGGAVAVAFAAIIGVPLFGFRVREVWYALTSSALVVVMETLFIIWEDIGGTIERYMPFQPDKPWLMINGTNFLTNLGLDPQAVWPWYMMHFNTYTPFYYIYLVMLVLVVYTNYRIRNSKLGFSLMALGEDEDAVEVLGVDSRRSKLTALIIYAFIAGVTGGVYASLIGFLHPSHFDVDLSTNTAIIGIVGGMGFTYGPLIAAIFLVSLKEYLRATMGGGLEGVYLVVYATILILVALFQPRGLAFMFQRIFAGIRATLGIGEKDGNTANITS